MRRSLLALVLLGGFFSMATGAVAQGAPLKGQIISGSKPIQTTTGSCSCTWPWYTFGLNPGQAAVTATMRTYSHIIAGSWGIRLFVYRGSKLIKWAQVACWANQRVCVRSISVKANVKKRGVYYARIEGPGADGIVFSIRVKGNVYAVRCSQSCQ